MNQGKADQAQIEAEILFPQVDILIKGEPITVNEITFSQGLKLGPRIKPMIAAMAALFGQEEDAELDDVVDVFGAHEAELNQLLALTTGKDIDWVKALSDTDGQNLMMMFWTVNRDFFTRRVVSKRMAALLKDQKSPSASAPSLPH